MLGVMSKDQRESLYALGGGLQAPDTSGADVQQAKDDKAAQDAADQAEHDRMQAEIELRDDWDIAMSQTGAEEAFYNGDKAASLGDKFKVMTTGLKGLGKTLGNQLSDPAVIGGMIMKGLKALYNLKGLSEKRNKAALIATSGVIEGQQMLAQASESKLIMFDDAVESARILRTELGFIPKTTTKTLEGVNALTEGYGLSGGEAANLFKTTSELGVTLSSMPEVVAGIGGEVENATGYAVDFQKTMKNLGGASASVRFNMKGQANELIKAANYASLLGMSMDEVRSAAESTLSFESSIQKEMEAEMFLQKNLNLDKYRYAALTGDAATQASELQRLIKENGPALKGNVLAQEAFADSLGISREQLTSSLESMELQKELGFESADAQKAMNILMAKGMTKEQAIIKMRKDGAAGVTKAIKDEEIFQNRFKKAQEKFQQVGSRSGCRAMVRNTRMSSVL